MTIGFDDTDDEPLARPARREGRRAGRVVLIVVIALVVIAGILWILDVVLRQAAQDAAASTIEEQLPQELTADVDVEIGGGPFLVQLVAGRFDEVTVTSTDAAYDGVPFGITVTANGVPLDQTDTIDSASAYVTIDEDALNDLLELPGTDPRLTLGQGTVSYEDEQTLLGLTVGYSVTAELEAAGDSVEITPVDAEITSGLGDLDVSGIVDAILGEGPVSVCVADRLPAVVDVSAIGITPESGTLTLTASDIPMTEEELSRTGACSAG